MSNSLDPEQVWRFVGPDQGPHCLQILSADNTARVTFRLLMDFFEEFFL